MKNKSLRERYGSRFFNIDFSAPMSISDVNFIDSAVGSYYWAALAVVFIKLQIGGRRAYEIAPAISWRHAWKLTHPNWVFSGEKL